jgi:hypothetical protein
MVALSRNTKPQLNDNQIIIYFPKNDIKHYPAYKFWKGAVF